MYNFIFWFFYRYFQRQKRFKSPFLSSVMVGLAILIHLGLVHAIIRYFTGFTLGTLSKDYTINKLMLLPFLSLAFFIIYKFYYQARTETILEKYGDKSPFTVKVVLSVLLIMVVPLVAEALLTNMAIKKFK